MSKIILNGHEATTEELLVYLTEEDEVDVDTLGYAMTDSEAFDKALAKASEHGLSYSKLIGLYLAEAKSDLIING